ncbi:M14 family zinc carboxypeptidase [Paenibacillus koleovorans]|uniref:M14 family zinc carboxypeptidase n=1 Tax=Paenibacillus koleovorans TaxID=121608 RepID=UPI000FDA6D82|nr:M14 family zinc carboxypeptidase [Paenibacillus koleovorans]
MAMAETFWKSRLTDIDACLSGVARGKVRRLAVSAGGRDIHVVEYGEKEDFGRRANYGSACGAGNPEHYARKVKDAKPVLLIVGGVHGGELEGIVAVVNLIRLLETGEDYRGRRHDELVEHARRFRLLLIPCMNPDGRARLPVDTLIDVPHDEFVYYMQGTWKDGTLCSWPACKAVHPIKDAADFLGSYFNDDGVNLMHDNFFAPMARETAALLELVDEEAPDFTVQLHGGANTDIHLYPIYFLPPYVMRKQQAFNQQLADAYKMRGLPFALTDQLAPYGETYPAPSFNLASAIHHACGGMSFTFESNMGLAAPGTKLTPDEILDSHFVLFEEMFRFSLGPEGTGEYGRSMV